MNLQPRSSYKKSISNIHNWYLERSQFLFKAAIALMTFLTVTRMGHHIWRLLFDQSPKQPIDLHSLYEWVNLWFAGEPLSESILLPATYAMLWPLLGWLSFESARWFWALLYFVSLTWLFLIVIRECGIKKRGEKLFAGLFLLSISSTGISIGSGQVILFLMPVILTAVLLEEEKGKGLAKDFIVSMLLLFSLLKIPVSAPFLLIPLITHRAIRALFITGFGYIALTLFSISFRDTGLIYILHEWIRDSSKLAVGGGYANLHIWLDYVGLKDLILPISFVSLIALGLWLYAYRKTDIWIQLGVAAIVARLWTYHRVYDDLLILIPLIAIFRIVRSRKLSGIQGIIADFLVLISFLAMFTPGYLLQLTDLWGTVFKTGQTVVWLSMLSFLIYYAYWDSANVKN